MLYIGAHIKIINNSGARIGGLIKILQKLDNRATNRMANKNLQNQSILVNCTCFDDRELILNCLSKIIPFQP